MTEEDPGYGVEELPEAVVDRRRRLSPIWLIPVAAVVVAGFLFWQSFMDQGATIQITFGDAVGIQAGKTTLRFRDVVVGVVEDVTVSQDLSEVIVTATLQRGGDAFRRDGTRFWVERARFGPQGISGMMTLVSGAYIGVDPGPSKAKHTHDFHGLAKPPINLRGEKGLRLVVNVQDFTTGLSYGSPVVHEGIQVGRISSLAFDKTGRSVEAEIFIEQEFSHLVFGNTRFWNASGFRMEASLSGIQVDLASLESLVVGGIGFATPGRDGKAASDGDEFSLFRNRRQALREYHESRGLHVFLDASERGSVKVGDDVLYRGEAVGRVLRHRLKDDSRLIGIEVQIFPRFAPLVRKDSKFWNSSGLSADLGLTGGHVHVSSLESLFEGSVSFSTPDPPGELAEKGTAFTLYNKPNDKWLKWQPTIRLKSDPDGNETAGLGRDDR